MLHKIERPLTARRGGLKALAYASAKPASFFYVLPKPKAAHFWVEKMSYLAQSPPRPNLKVVFQDFK